MGNIGVPELIVIFIVALLVFGPKKLPEIGKSLGKGLREFQRARNELVSTIEDEVHSIRQETVQPAVNDQRYPPAVSQPSSEVKPAS
jgi:sec-independent protein translocase protein TatA